MLYILACHLQSDADTVPVYYFDADPDHDLAYHWYADPDPTFQFYADPDPQHCRAGWGTLKSFLKPLEYLSFFYSKVLNSDPDPGAN